MKKKFEVLVKPYLFTILFLGLTGNLNIACAEQWHPMNKKLHMMYPNDKMPFKHPSVPRVMPLAALQFYKTGKAIFIKVGHDGATIKGAIHLAEQEAWKINVAKIKKFAGKRYIITYCG